MIRDDHVMVCIPYYRCQQYIRRAVLSILGQTHKNLTLVVVNDADFETPPWPVLSDITDRRLVRFDLTKNHGGPFYANSVVLNAIDSMYFLVQEQDDWSEPERIEELLLIMQREKTNIATSGQKFYEEDLTGNKKYLGLRWRNPVNTQCQRCDPKLACTRCYVDNRITESFKLRAPHTSLFKTTILKKIGGYYCGFNMHFDTLIMNLVLAVGSISHTPKPLYNRSLRSDSLTGKAKHGELLAKSKYEHDLLIGFYDEVVKNYNEYLSGRIKGSYLIDSIAKLSESKLSPERKHNLLADINLLRINLSNTIYAAN